MILATFDLQVTLMLPTKFGVNWPFGSGEEAKNRFSRSHPNASYQVWRTGLLVQEKKRKIDFQDGHHGGHLGFPIGMISAIFDLQVTLMLPSKFGINWPFSSEEEAKNRFSRWRTSWISNLNDFS